MSLQHQKCKVLKVSPLQFRLLRSKSRWVMGGSLRGGWKISISLARRRFPLEKRLNVAVEICRLSAYLTAKQKVRYSSPFSPGTDKKWYSLPGTWYVWYLLVLLACWHTHNHCTCWYPLIKTVGIRNVLRPESGIVNSSVTWLRIMWQQSCAHYLVTR
jgi:hypothetical protein